jgi:hypothetical protein
LLSFAFCRADFAAFLASNESFSGSKAPHCRNFRMLAAEDLNFQVT